MMVNENEIRKLFQAYIKGNCSPDEVKKALYHLSTPNGEKIYKKLLEEDSNLELTGNLDGNFKHSLYENISDSIRKERKISDNRWKTGFIRYAAVFILLLSATFVIYRYSGLTKDNLSAVEYKEITTPAKQRPKEIILADGTKVWLNRKSTLKYPEKFAGNTRLVFLEGEAVEMTFGNNYPLKFQKKRYF